jgi:hypothetical protein
MKPLPGVLIHGCALATLNRGVLFEPADTLSTRVILAIAVLMLAIIVGLRMVHAGCAPVGQWPFQYLEILVFGAMSFGTILVCQWLARANGVVWPHFLWMSGALAVYPFAEPVYRAIAASPRIIHASISTQAGGARGD